MLVGSVKSLNERQNSPNIVFDFCIDKRTSLSLSLLKPHDISLAYSHNNNNNTKFVKRRVAVASEALANRTVKKHRRRRTNVL